MLANPHKSLHPVIGRGGIRPLEVRRRGEKLSRCAKAIPAAQGNQQQQPSPDMPLAYELRQQPSGKNKKQDVHQMQIAQGLQLGKSRHARRNADGHRHREVERRKPEQRATQQIEDGQTLLARDAMEPPQQRHRRRQPQPLIPRPAQQEEIRSGFEHLAVGIGHGRKQTEGQERAPRWRRAPANALSVRLIPTTSTAYDKPNTAIRG